MNLIHEFTLLTWAIKGFAVFAFYFLLVGPAIPSLPELAQPIVNILYAAFSLALIFKHDLLIDLSKNVFRLRK